MAPTATLRWGRPGMVLAKHVIAAIEGHGGAGGLELAIWGDLRVVRGVSGEEAAAVGLVNVLVELDASLDGEAVAGRFGARSRGRGGRLSLDPGTAKEPDAFASSSSRSMLCVRASGLPTITLLRDCPTKQLSHLSLEVSAVSTQRSDRRQLACLRPPGHGLRVYPKKCRNLRRREQGF